MKNTDEKMIQTVLRLVEENNLFNFHEVAQFLDTTVRELRKMGVVDDVDIRDQLEANREKMKASMRRKWYKSDNPSMQMNLYKLLATPEEWFRLAGSSFPEQYVSQNKDKEIVWKITGINDD